MNITKQITNAMNELTNIGRPNIYDDCVIVHVYNNDGPASYIQVDYKNNKVVGYSIHNDVDEDGYYNNSNYIFPSVHTQKDIYEYLIMLLIP